MGYSTFKSSPKSVTTAEQIGPGQIDLHHLAPALFAEIRSIALHSHTGAKSRKVNIRNLEGSFGIDGFYIYSNTGNKRFKVTVSDAGAFILTEA